MKKTILRLALLLMATVSVNANTSLPIHDVELNKLNLGVEPGRFEVNFEDGFALSGEIERLGENAYVYNAELIAADGESVGVYTLYFQTESWGGEEVAIYDSMYAEYSNDRVKTEMNSSTEISKAKHETAKCSINNLR